MTLHGEAKKGCLMNFERSKTLQPHVHALIPGGSHTYAKGDDQYPELAPAYIARGEGCYVWDVDGNRFVEYGMGLRAVTLGHGFRPVIDAAYRQMLLGNNFTRPALIEYECAQKMLSIIDGGEMIKFAKNGSDVTTAAVKLARAVTGRSMVAVCADQPFFSVDDWFIGSTSMSAGIPETIQNMTLKFRYNSIQSVEALFSQYPDQIACLIMEPEATEPPAPGFLQNVQRLCHANGALFILDESITGFRWHLGGAQKYYDIVPDLSTFGKAMGNGFAAAALIGKREFMERGGLHHNHERVFLLSTTHGAENHALAAVMATIQTYQECNVIAHLHRSGERLRKAINHAVGELQLEEYFQVIGKPCNLIFATRDQEKNRSQPFRTLFMQEMIRRGFLTPSLVVSFAHTDSIIDQTAEAVAESLVIYRRALEDGVEKYLRGHSVKPVFRSYN
jgi:glutamate-1-semialdehyde 2,1-aminomutase